MKVASDFKKTARESLKDNWVNAILASLIYTLLIGVASSISVALLIVCGALEFGFVKFYLTLHREQRSDMNIMFQGFNSEFSDYFIIGLLKYLFVALWTLLFIIPGIVKSYSYAMTMYIKNDHPEIKGNDCIKKSMEMMNGNKWRLFCLDFSFIGWILVCILTFGIGFIFLDPYMEAARAAFYEDLKAENGEKTAIEVVDLNY